MISPSSPPLPGCRLALRSLFLPTAPLGSARRPGDTWGGELQSSRRPTALTMLFWADTGLRGAGSRPEMFLKDSNLKDKLIKHFTGPITFPDECSIHFHRLYHNTRDCSTPAYYKRCARLLTRLAVSPLCSQTRPALGALLKNMNTT
ncbi:Hypothetical predicted protein [Lynx pardinus]|uniref:ALK and LTK ligand 1 n=1 Tax=Lynx pardinus TaxID=191816 RepID=A0A485MV11_LYNPA|nr:Hypothetical predicted protein [Lynx pardinus]